MRLKGPYKYLYGILLGIAGHSVAYALTPTEIFSKNSPSVWGVKTYDKDGLPLASGSAVVIAPEILITNCHVLRKATRITIKLENISIGATLEMWDTVRDLCQIKAKNLAAPAVKIGSAFSLAVGQSIYTLGNPRGLELTFGAGLVSSLRRNDQKQLELVQISAPISPGSSGGGLFDDQGRLVGITTLQIKDGQNLNFAVPAEWIKELPARHLAARNKETQETSLAESKKPTETSLPKKTWRYQFSGSSGKRLEFSVIETSNAEGKVLEEVQIADHTLPALEWTANSGIFRMRAGQGIEWAEVSPDLFKSQQGSHSIRGATLLGSTYNVSIRLLGQEPVFVGGKTYTATRIELRGEKDPAPPSVQMLYGFTVQAWYASDLGRVIKTRYTSSFMNGQVAERSETQLLTIPDTLKASEQN